MFYFKLIHYKVFNRNKLSICYLTSSRYKKTLFFPYVLGKLHRASNIVILCADLDMYSALKKVLMLQFQSQT